MTKKNENRFRPLCFRCGTELIQSGNGEYGDEDANVFYYVCPLCGDDYEECELPESEKKLYPYWNEEDN